MPALPQTPIIDSRYRARHFMQWYKLSLKYALTEIVTYICITSYIGITLLKKYMHTWKKIKEFPIFFNCEVECFNFLVNTFDLFSYSYQELFSYS